MKKYNKQVLLNYINGLDTMGYELEDLENDKEFMMEAILYTKDKNLYELCSNELKKDYEFIRFMITTFSSDKKFINDIAEEYIKDIDETDITYKELIVLMSSLLSKNEVNLFNAKALAFYINETIKLSVLEKSETLSDIIPNFGVGFLVIKTEYETSDIIQKFFAERFISNIFFGRINMNFEQLVHSYAKDIKSIEEMGKNTFFLKIISDVDTALYEYVTTHMELLKEVSKEYEKVKKNWESYKIETNLRKIAIFYQESYKIAQELDGVCCEEICEYVINKLGLKEIFSAYEMDLPSDLEWDFSRFESKTLDFNEMSTLKKILNLAKELFGQEVIISSLENDDYKIEETKNIKGQVININF